MSITRRHLLQASTLVASGAIGITRRDVAAAPATFQSGKLTAWSFAGGAVTAGLESQVQAFNERYPDVEVEIQTFGYQDTHTNLLNAIVAGSGAPDLCAIDVLFLTQYVDGLVDLSAHRAEYQDEFIPPTLDLGVYQDKLYGLPGDSQPIGMYYRRDIWDEYGITEEEIETWDDLIEAGNRVNQESGGEVQLYAMFGNDFNLYEMLAVEQGFAGYYFDETDTKVIVDDPKIIEAVHVIKRLWDGEGVLHNAGTTYFADEMTVLLKNGTVATQIVGPAWYPSVLTEQMPELAGQWRFMRVPAIEAGGPRVGYQYPTILVIPEQSEQQELAWEFAIMGLTGDGAQAMFDETHVLPAWAPLFNQLIPQPDEYFGGQNTFELWDAISRDTPEVFFGTGFTEAQQIVGNHLQQIVTGSKSPEDGMREAAEEMRQKLNKS